MSKIRAKWVITLLLLFVLPLSAGVTVFQGSDPSSTAGVPANSNAAAVSFNNAIQSSSSRLITFENDPTGIGTFFNLAGAGTGGSVNVQCFNCDTNLPAAYSNFASGIRQNDTSLPTNQYGYNTTAGGSNLFRFTPTVVTTLTNFVVQFNFQNAIQAFGTFVTGMQQSNGSLFLQFNDGASQSFAFTGNPTALGGIQFIGFTTTAQVTRVEFRLSAITSGFRDIMAFDDIRLGLLDIGGGGGPLAENPEPSTYALFAGGLAALAIWRRKRRTSA